MCPVPNRQGRDVTHKIHPDVRKLLNEINAYRTKHGLDRTKFGILAANDGHLLPRLETGREPRRSTVEKVRAFMRSKK
jgi:hypothetical protein